MQRRAREAEAKFREAVSALERAERRAAAADAELASAGVYMFSNVIVYACASTYECI